jgi:Fe-S cluster biogenesis protein NfuA
MTEKEQKTQETADFRQAVEKSLQGIRPALQAEGGDVEFVGLEGKVVKVRLTGACAGCPFAQLTLQSGIERRLKHEVPEVERVEAV